MTQPEETPVSFIPSNFIEKGKILNGTFDIRNAIESIVLSLAIGIPVFHLPLSLTARIIILCMTALPAAMVALIGIGGESITAFLMNALRFVVNRRVIWRSDSLPEGKPRRKPRFKEPKTKKHRKAEKMAEPSKVMASAPPQSEPDAKLAFADLLPRARAGRLAGGLPVSERVRVPLVPVRARREPQPREGERTARKQRREDSFPMLFHFLFSFLPLCSNHCTIRTIQV